MSYRSFNKQPPVASTSYLTSNRYFLVVVVLAVVFAVVDVLAVVFAVVFSVEVVLAVDVLFAVVVVFAVVLATKRGLLEEVHSQ